MATNGADGSVPRLVPGPEQPGKHKINAHAMSTGAIWGIDVFTF
jgi:hypothetical protein